MQQPRSRTAPVRLAQALVSFVALEAVIAAATDADARKLVLAALGVAIGATLLLARFGFAAAFRDATRTGDAGAFIAHMLMLALASALIVPLVAQGAVFGHSVTGFATPVGVAFMTGAVLFGLGMTLAGGCASGTLFLLGGGDIRFAGTLAGFVLGSTLGAAQIGFWHGLPALPPATVFSFGADWRVGLGAQIALCLSVAAVLLTRGHRPARRLLWGGVALAVLNCGGVLASGRPWSETFGFALWGSKLAARAGFVPAEWPFWRGSEALGGSIFAERTSITDLSIMLGAFLAATLSRRFIWRWPKDWRDGAAAVLAGVVMGYGARLSGGCNIGAYFSAIASGDFSGWAWLLGALAGAPLGERLRRRVTVRPMRRAALA